MILCLLLCSEFAFRLYVEFREARITKKHNVLFSILRTIPLLNDFVPLPEAHRLPKISDFESYHEEGHRFFHHSLLRNIQKITFLLLAVGFLLFLMTREMLPLWQCALWLHIAVIPFRILFHLYCWKQEFEADGFAQKKLGKQKSKCALNELITCEIPHTRFFALLYREHPMAVTRWEKLFRH